MLTMMMVNFSCLSGIIFTMLVCTAEADGYVKYSTASKSGDHPEATINV